MKNAPYLIPRARFFTEHPRDRDRLTKTVETLLLSIRDKAYPDTLKIMWHASGDLSPLVHCTIEWAEEDPAPQTDPEKVT